MAQIQKIACPGCDRTLAEEDLYSNVLHCPYCGRYTYYEAGMFNENIFFGLVKSNTSDYDGLKQVLMNKMLHSKQLKELKKKIKYINIERFLVPVREICVDGVHQYVPMLEVDAEAVRKEPDIRRLLKRYINDLGKKFAIHSLRPLRLEAIKDVTDRFGHIYKTHIMQVGLSKYSVDEAYHIPPNEMLRILYFPIFRLSFGDKMSSITCLGDNELTGLEVYFEEQENRKRNIFGISFSTSFGLSFLASIPLAIWYIWGKFDSWFEYLLNFIFNYIVFVLAGAISLGVVLFLLGKTGQTCLRVFHSRRIRTLGKILMKRFDYKMV